MSSLSAAAGAAAQARDADKRRRKQQLVDNFYASSSVNAYRYRVNKVIGQGAYGVVVAATDTLTGEQVAVKRIMRVLDSPGMATRILRELKFLRFLNAHENIVTVRDVLLPGERDRFNDVFVVFERMPTDLGRLLRSRTKLTEEHHRFMMFQLLRGIHFLHSARVFHRDLNPNNILVNADCVIRICDFGLARAAFQRGDDSVFWTDYVATRWYRAPELILAHSAKYSTAIDMWSVGCIFAEMIGGGKPLFPGSNAREQFGLIVNVTGRPAPHTLAKIKMPEAYARSLNALPAAPRTALNVLYPEASAGAIDLLSRLLTFDPDERITAEQALQLPYFAEYRKFGLGQTREPLDEREFAFERKRLSQAEMRAELLREVAEYHPEAKQQLLNGGMVYEYGSPAEHFGKGMSAVKETDKRNTISSETFVAINQSEQPQAAKEFKTSTWGQEQYREVSAMEGVGEATANGQQQHAGHGIR